jgi:hypothetical protein
MSVWAFARVKLGLSEDEFNRLSPVQFAALVDMYHTTAIPAGATPAPAPPARRTQSPQEQVDMLKIFTKSIGGTIL